MDYLREGRRASQEEEGEGEDGEMTACLAQSVEDNGKRKDRPSK